MDRHGMLRILAALGLPAVMGLVLPVADAAAAELSYEEFTKMAQAAVGNGEVAVDEPMIRVEGRQLIYYLGGAGYILDPAGPAFDPIEQPMRRQFQVAVIRKYRSSPKNRNFWNPVLQRVSGVIAEQLAVVQSEGLGEDEMFERLGPLDERIDGIYASAMQSYARGRGLQAFPAHPYAPPFTVRLVTSPPGAEIYLIHAVENRLAKARGKKPTWHRVEHPGQVELRGKYWYMLKWPGRTRVGRRPFQPTANGTITLR